MINGVRSDNGSDRVRTEEIGVPRLAAPGDGCASGGAQTAPSGAWCVVYLRAPEGDERDASALPPTPSSWLPDTPLDLTRTPAHQVRLPRPLALPRVRKCAAFLDERCSLTPPCALRWRELLRSSARRGAGDVRGRPRLREADRGASSGGRLPDRIGPRGRGPIHSLGRAAVRVRRIQVNQIGTPAPPGSRSLNPQGSFRWRRRRRKLLRREAHRGAVALNAEGRGRFKRRGGDPRAASIILVSRACSTRA